MDITDRSQALHRIHELAAYAPAEQQGGREHASRPNAAELAEARSKPLHQLDQQRQAKCQRRVGRRRAQQILWGHREVLRPINNADQTQRERECRCWQ
jgi:hypothetical protein